MRTANTLPDMVAAVDLGSNSFHMIVARVTQGRLQVLDRLRERVQLAAGLNKSDDLTERAQQRALACLRRFGERLRGLPPGSVRVVGTNTFRRARNAAQFLSAAQRVLGHPIEVIGGREEARLIYLGVAHSLADTKERRLVVDIGGGSTELIIGRGFEPLHMESLAMGCVRGSLHYFPRGLISRAHFERAEIAAQQELQPLAARYRAVGWRECVGASGTINAVQDVIRAQGWSEHGITLASLVKLRKALIAAGSVQRLKLLGLRSERAGVFPGGVAILMAIFKSLGITRMTNADGALREGVLHDMLGRLRRREDVRERSVQWLALRTHADAAQALRVEHTALLLLKQVAQAWHLHDPEDAHILKWAARLHEMGLSISHGQHHKHGAYLAEHTDMAGFSRRDQQLLALLILGQRGKIPVEAFAVLPGRLKQSGLHLCVLLRLAVLLNRSRSARPLSRMACAAAGKSLKITLPKFWAARQPLTQADLEEEIIYLKGAGIRLKLT